MPLADLPGIGQEADLNGVKDYLIGLKRYLGDFLNHLDTLNVEELDANVILANTITAGKMNVTQLSAIAADLGTITAGLMNAVQIFGSYIATKNGSYPRSEMNASGDFFAAYKDAANYLQVAPNFSGVPVISLTIGGIDVGTLSASASAMILFSAAKSVISASTDIELNANGNVVVPQWARVYSTGNAQTLQQALNNKANAFSGFTGTVYVASTSGGPTTTAKNFVNGVCTS